MCVCVCVCVFVCMGTSESVREFVWWRGGGVLEVGEPLIAWADPGGWGGGGGRRSRWSRNN